MSVHGRITKKDKQISVSKASVWGTGVSVALKSGVHSNSFSPPAGGREVFTNAEDCAVGMKTWVQAGSYTEQSGSVGKDLTFEGCEKFFDAVMGSQTTEEVVTGKVWKKKYVLSLEFLAKIFSMAWDEGKEIVTIPSVIFQSLGISLSNGFQLSSNFAGNKLEKATGNLDLTYESGNELRPTLGETDVYLKDAESAEDFTASDIIVVKNINIDVARNFEAGVPVSSSMGTCAPDEQSMPDVSMSLEHRRKDAQNQKYYEDFDKMKQKKLKVHMKGGKIADTEENYSISVCFPRCGIFEAPGWSFDGTTGSNVKFEALKAPAAPTGMSEAVPYIEVVNGLNESY